MLSLLSILAAMVVGCHQLNKIKVNPDGDSDTGQVVKACVVLASTIALAAGILLEDRFELSGVLILMLAASSLGLSVAIAVAKLAYGRHVLPGVQEQSEQLIVQLLNCLNWDNIGHQPRYVKFNRAHYSLRSIELALQAVAQRGWDVTKIQVITTTAWYMNPPTESVYAFERRQN